MQQYCTGNSLPARQLGCRCAALSTQSCDSRAGGKTGSVNRLVSWNARAAVHQADPPVPQASRLLQDSLLTSTASQAHQSCSSILISMCHGQQRSRQLQQRPTWQEWEEGMVLLIIVTACCNALIKDSVPDQQAWGSCMMATTVSRCGSALIPVQLFRDDQRAQQLALHKKFCLITASSCLEGG